MNKARDTIGRRLTAARKAEDLSQREVAELLGIPPRTLSYYESFNGDLPSSLLVPLSDILGVETNELLGIETTEDGERAENARKSDCEVDADPDIAVIGSFEGDLKRRNMLLLRWLQCHTQRA